MDFDPTDEQRMLLESVSRFVSRSYKMEERAAALKRELANPQSNWNIFAENGWLAVALPQEYDGLGGGIVDVALIAGELGKALVTEPFLGCAVRGAQILAACAGSSSAKELLPLVAAGECRIALAHSETQHRGESVALTAVPMADGYRLEGRKALAPGGAEADRFVVSATGGDGLYLFVVDSNAAGLKRTVVALHDSSRAARLQFDGVLVSSAQLLAGPDHAPGALRHGLAYGTAAICAGLVGVMERAIDITADYVNVRKQFGVAIGSFQAIQHRLADMASEMELARSMLFALLAAFENGDIEARDRVAARARMLIGASAVRVCGEAIQLHGGIGMTEEHIIGHYYQRAVVDNILLKMS